MNSNARVQAWRERTPIEVRRAADRERYARKSTKWERHIKATYGVDASDYRGMFESQGGCCAICRKPQTDARLCIDHDHATGKVRGLLCSRCNQLVGYAGDDPSTLFAAASYLNAEAAVAFIEAATAHEIVDLEAAA